MPAGISLSFCSGGGAGFSTGFSGAAFGATASLKRYPRELCPSSTADSTAHYLLRNKETMGQVQANQNYTKQQQSLIFRV
ncbi:uncharacterized protein A4U43_C03F25200 [Asparagus officinalis]|uniref:Uncharacterized protein n=1 Tax=Asparagus officinalis TaxID=4686 RepID=A0A5P1FDS7_ASPOF|nr:uncharacterized protein A4U43_C03F25200 [Asparagus officinalis]